MDKRYYTLITGASEGFGKALSLECAKRKMNLILVALPSTGLPQLAAFIEKNFDVEAIYFECDLTQKECCFRVFQSLQEKSLFVNILINNAGIGGTHFFTEKNSEYYCRLIELNVLAPTLLSHYFIRQMQSNMYGYILNVSSLASFFSLPRKQVYGGSKSYLISFSKSLSRELKAKKIYVSTICPGGMNTSPRQILLNRTGNIISRWSIMNPEDVAKIAIDKMEKRKEIIIPGKWNRLFLFLDKLLPDIIKKIMIGRLMKQLHPANSSVIS